MIRRIFCVALITLGAGLDAYFYAFRFTADGLPVGVAIACALALEILLAFCVLHARGSRVFTGFAVALTLYAVIQTSAGQTFSLMTRDAGAGDTSATSKTLMAEEKKNLDRLDAEYSTITKQLASIHTVEDRAVYGGTVYRMTARLAELSRERGASSVRLSGLADKTGQSEINRVKDMSIYGFYASMPKWAGMDWLKFLFHTFLSFGIAIMTPIGVLTWDVKSAARVLKKSGLTETEVGLFVKICWKKVSAGSREQISPAAPFYDYCEQNNIVVSPDVYEKCFSRAVALGLVTRDRTALIKDEELIKTKIFKGA